MYRTPAILARGTPCRVRRAGPWRDHVCACDTRLSERLPHGPSPHWLYRQGGWEILVEPRLLARSDESAEGRWAFSATGTREGATAAQLDAARAHLALWLTGLIEPPAFHHGGCTGADRDLHRLVRELWGRMAWVVIHPASDQPAHLCDWSDADELLEVRPSLDRNRDVAEAARHGVLLACPKLMCEERRSGTWATVRYADSRRLGSIIFWPDGTTGARGG